VTPLARGRCGGCGGDYSVTMRGLIRSHWSGTPKASEAQWGRADYGICVGAGMPPIGPAEPLITTELTELRRENAELRKAAVVLQAHVRALEARAQADHHLEEANRKLLDLLGSFMDADRSSRHARNAQWDALIQDSQDRLTSALARIREVT
jgi:hypothetical protein